MLERASGQFIIDGQVEDIVGGILGAARIARISQSCRFVGQLEGESIAEFTAVLPREGDGSFHGFQRVAGTLGEREGTFVLSVTGEIRKGQPRGSWTIVSKSGSGDFAHIRGGGSFSLPDGKPGTYALEFDLRKPRATKSPVVEEGVATPTSTRDDVIAVPIDVVKAPVATTEKRSRKSPVQQSEPTVENTENGPAKRTRTRNVKPESAEPSVVAAQQAKRSRSQTTGRPASTPEIGAEPPTKRARQRTSEPAVGEQPISTSTPKPKRARKTPSTESAAVVADPYAEPTSTKPARRTKPVPPEPIALSVTEPSPTRKRRAKAA